MSFLLNPFVFAGAAGAFESIATVTVGSGGASSIEFTSIPGTYQHLQVRGVAKAAGGTSWYNGALTFNSDTATNYSVHILQGQGTAASAAGYVNTSSIYTPMLAAGNKTYFGAWVIDLLDYADTSKYKTVRSFTGTDQNGSGYVQLTSGSWRSTAAISSVTISLGLNLVEHSTAALYGIKA